MGLFSRLKRSKSTNAVRDPASPPPTSLSPTTVRTTGLRKPGQTDPRNAQLEVERERERVRNLGRRRRDPDAGIAGEAPPAYHDVVGEDKEEEEEAPAYTAAGTPEIQITRTDTERERLAVRRAASENAARTTRSHSAPPPSSFTSNSAVAAIGGHAGGIDTGSVQWTSGYHGDAVTAQVQNAVAMDAAAQTFVSATSASPLGSSWDAGASNGVGAAVFSGF